MRRWTIPSTTETWTDWQPYEEIKNPYNAKEEIENIPGSVFTGLSDHSIVVDTGNYYPGTRDKEIKGLGEGQAESLWLLKKRRRERPSIL